MYKNLMIRSIVETLDRRLQFCSVAAGEPSACGAVAPWLTAPLTSAAEAAAEQASSSSSATGGGIGDGASPARSQFAVLATGSAEQSDIRINAGGSAYTTGDGRVFAADTFFSGGTADAGWVFPVANTSDDPLYYTRRYGNFAYNIPVNAGTYAVTLHFADPKYTTAGSRNFDVIAEGVTRLNDLDVAAGGGGQAAISRTFTVTVSDGVLNLGFVKQLDNPILSAIEVIPTDGGPVSPPPPPPASGGGTVSGLTLYNASTDTVIGSLNDGAQIDLSGGKSYGLVASASGVGSVKFLIDGQPIKIESAAPYSIGGDTNAGKDILPWSVPTGTHTLSVVPYSQSGAGGTAGVPLTVSFTATNSGPVSPPPPTGGSVDTFTQINYVTKAPSPIVRAEALTAKTADRLYVFGGFSGTLGPVVDSHYYSPASNTWTKIADLPQRLTHVGVTQDDQNVYFIGGYVGKPGQTGYGQTYGSNKVWMYNFASNSYSALPNLPQALAAGGAALIGRKLHYFGGQNSSRADINIHLVLDLDNLAAGWKTAKAIPHGRSHMGAVALDGKIYTVAGQIGNDDGLTTQKYVEVYDPASDQWAALAPLPAATSHIASATFVMGGRIIVMGGESSHNHPVRDAWAYNPQTNKWVALTGLPAPKFSGVANEIQGKIVFTTGGSAATTWVGTPG